MPPSSAFASLIPALHNEASNATFTGEVPAASAIVQMQPNIPLAVQPTVPIAATQTAAMPMLAAAPQPAPTNAADCFGLYLGDGVMPIPQKLVNKIVALEYIEMKQLLPESWLFEDNAHCCDKRDRPKKPEITNIFSWLHCYSALVGVLASRYPHKVAQLMAYQSTIVKCHSDFEGSAWMAYDRAFRRQAAAKKTLDWSQLNPTLYSLCFAGKAKTDIVCTSCLSREHKSMDCPDRSSKRYQQRSTAPGSNSSIHREGSVEICRLYNAKGGSKCRFKECRYAHLCRACKRPHPWSSCANEAPELKKPKME